MATKKEKTMEDRNRIEELHKSLDKLALQSLDLIEELLEERKQFDQSLRDGFFEITRARHVMGSKSVGVLQLPLDGGRSTEATAKVDRNASLEDLIEHLNFTIAPAAVAEKGSIEGTEDKTEDGLRKRGGKKSNETAEGSESAMPLSNNLKKTNGVRDPLTWFGVLVPRSLRESQRIFQNSLHSLCKIASLQTNLETVRNKFKEFNKELEQLKQGVAQ